jgi:hypothetical protein
VEFALAGLANGGGNNRLGKRDFDDGFGEIAGSSLVRPALRQSVHREAWILDAASDDDDSNERSAAASSFE